MNLEELRKLFKKLMARSKELRSIKPEELTDEQATELRELIPQIEQCKSDIDTLVRADALDRDADAGGDGDHRSTITVGDQPIYRGSHASALGQQLADVAVVSSRGMESDVVQASKTRLEQNTKRALVLIEQRQGQEPSREFQERSMAVFNPEFRAAGTGMVQGIGSEGGFLLQSETSIDLMTHGFNNSEVLSRCSRRTLTGSESLEIVGIDETSRANGSRGGGIRVYTDAELSQMTSSRTKFEKIKLAPERLTGLYYASDKILMNATFLGQEMRQLFMEEFAFKTQDLVMEGTGAGQALGVKNAACVVEVSKETGQAATTIVTENVLNMYMRFYPGAGGRAAWFANRNCFMELFKLKYEIGTGGEMARLYSPPSTPGGQGSMLGYPVIFIEQAESLGTAGDIQLNDFSQYVTVDYGDINEASSIHLKFDYGQTAFRFIYYFDGQPRWVSALTPFKGSSSTLSPFVRVAARS